MKPLKDRVQIKLKRQLYDVFQSSRVNCNGWCCGWHAFNLSDHWIGRWCEFRDEKELLAIRIELEDVRSFLEQNDNDPCFEIVDFLLTDATSLRSVVDRIEGIVNENLP